MDPQTGRVLAMAGGWSYAMSQFNRAVQAQRQPGSSFKPFVYLAAMDAGFTPSTIVEDAPFEYAPGYGQPVWRPSNYGGGFLGPLTVRNGLEKSRNLMTVRMASQMGMKRVVKVAKEFGIMDNMYAYLPMALGAGDTTLLRMTMGHATDRPILEEIFRQNRVFPFLGVIGSKAKRAVILKELAAAGIPKEIAGSFHCPIGLELGTNQPGEIAISVVAQLIQERDRWRAKIPSGA